MENSMYSKIHEETIEQVREVNGFLMAVFESDQERILELKMMIRKLMVHPAIMGTKLFIEARATL